MATGKVGAAMFIWRGLGLFAFLIPMLIWLAIALVAIFLDYYEPDEMKAAAAVYRMMAGGFALGALAVWAFARYRERTAPGEDDLAFIPLKYWPAIVALAAAAALVASFVPAALRAFS